MANIRLKDLTSVENIADTDVIVIDGEAGTRVTTWAKMKELIKAQCGINELNTEISNAPGFGKVYATTMSITADANSGGWALVGPFDSAPYYPVAVIPMTAMYATSPICLTSAYHVKITSWNGDNVPLPITIGAFVLWAKI